MSVHFTVNTTEGYYYYDYNNADFPTAQSCPVGTASLFGKVFLPILYSLVFIVGFTGDYFCERVFVCLLIY